MSMTCPGSHVIESAAGKTAAASPQAPRWSSWRASAAYATRLPTSPAAAASAAAKTARFCVAAAPGVAAAWTKAAKCSHRAPA